MNDAIHMSTDTSVLMPWPDQATALSFLRAFGEPASSTARLKHDMVLEPLVTWLISQGIGPFAADCYSESWPELAQALRIDVALASAENDLYFQSLEKLLAVLNAADIECVLLKGAALALDVYHDRALRTMSDIDIWLRAETMQRSIEHLAASGFHHTNRGRSDLLSLSATGKIKFNLPGWSIGGLELHTNPFTGIVLQKTARVDLDAIWARRRGIVLAVTSAYRMSAEDMILHVAAHLAVSNQFCMAALRGLLDIALTARKYAIDWAALADRALRWRIAVPIWLSLHYADAIFGLPDVASALTALQPSRTRRKLLARYVTLDRILAGYDFRTRQNRHIYLALLVSSPFAS